MRYVNPRNVIGPQDYVLDVQVLYDGGGTVAANSFSLARIKWEGRECFAIRWNVAIREFDDPEKQQGKECVGLPSSHGYPVWFVLPDDMVNTSSEAWKEINRYKGEPRSR